MSREVPQIVGDGLLPALEQGVPAAGALAHDCVAALTSRDWVGDAELVADLQRAQGHPGAPPLTPLTVELDQLVDLLRGGEHHAGGRLNVRTGETVPELYYADLADAGYFDDEDSDQVDRDAWLYVDPVGPRVGWRDMERFIDDRVPTVIAGPLRDAITGKGAFARFRTRIDQWPDLADDWHRYSEGRWTGRARHWLATAGYRPTRSTTHSDPQAADPVVA